MQLLVTIRAFIIINSRSSRYSDTNITILQLCLYSRKQILFCEDSQSIQILRYWSTVPVINITEPLYHHWAFKNIGHTQNLYVRIFYHELFINEKLWICRLICIFFLMDLFWPVVMVYWKLDYPLIPRNNRNAQNYKFFNFFLDKTLFLPIVNQRAKFIVTWVHTPIFWQWNTWLYNQ